MKTNEAFETNDTLQLQTAERVSAPPSAGAPGRSDISSDTQLPRLAYSVKEAAAILGVSDKTVRRLIDRGLLKPSRALRHLLIPTKEIERFLNDTTVK